MYAGFAALMVSGILRAIETFSQQRAWNDPDAVWVTLLGLINWSANVFLPVYGVLQVVMAIMHYGGVGFRIYPGAPWARPCAGGNGVFWAFGSSADGGILRRPRNRRSQLGGRDASWRWKSHRFIAICISG